MCHFPHILRVFEYTIMFTDPWIHEGGHGEVDEDKEGDDTLEDGNRIPVLLQNVPLDTPKEEFMNNVIKVKMNLREVEEQGCGAQK